MENRIKISDLERELDEIENNKLMRQNRNEHLVLFGMVIFVVLVILGLVIYTFAHGE